MPASHFIISGTVQGVFFRASAKEKADTLKLTGWVYNRSAGTVEVYAEGETAALEKLEQWLHEGPPAAQVKHVEAKKIDEIGYTTFDIR